MFRLLRWRVEYEPCDFNGWIPDFVIIGAQQNTFAEIKPVTRFPKDVAQKIDSSGCNDEVIILGMTLPIAQHPSGFDNGFGWLRQMDEVDGVMINSGWGVAPYGIWSGTKGGHPPSNLEKIIGFAHGYISFHDRITGLYDGGGFGNVWLDENLVPYLWAQAGNEVQWNRR